ncbi:MAG: hypothetical protein J6T03_03635 [Bacteroidales bacterium]|nr:hypothetical protein [Bacteroidales bacterium]
MQSYTGIVSNEAAGDLDEIVEYIASVFKSARGHNFVNRILGQIQGLSYSGGIIVKVLLQWSNSFTHTPRQ